MRPIDWTRHSDCRPAGVKSREAVPGRTRTIAEFIDFRFAYALGKVLHAADSAVPSPSSLAA